jgi:hypothetical protein
LNGLNARRPSKLEVSSRRQSTSDPLGQDPRDDIVRNPRWPTAAVIATYRYVLEGVRILGEAHSTYDGRGPQ